MKILWFTTCVFPEVADSLGLKPFFRQGWIVSLGHALNERGLIQLAVVTIVREKKDLGWRKKEIGGIMHYALPLPEGGNYEIIVKPGRKLLDECKKIVEDFSPDVVHFHGTEFFYGVLSADGIINYPSVVSLQGLIGEYYQVYFGGLSFKEIIKCQSLLAFLLGRGIINEKRMWKLRVELEKKIIKGNDNFIGRTLFDKEYLYKINPQARYYHCNELLRSPFYSAQWGQHGINKYSIFAPSAHYPLKGFHWLLRAAALLKRDFPSLTIRVTEGLNKNKLWNDYASYLYELISSLGLKDCVIPLGMIPAEEMARELSQAHAFVIPSLVENSPNSLAEAMLVGVPCVASFVGGIPSMIKNGENALVFPAGNTIVLAEHLRRIFSDDHLAQHLGKTARETALRRHDKENIVRTMTQIYADVQKRGK
jgi:glycosyltransferase involved in cell wall biosynthesis